jgi:hypothetical protein
MINIKYQLEWVRSDAWRVVPELNVAWYGKLDNLSGAGVGQVVEMYFSTLEEASQGIINIAQDSGVRDTTWDISCGVPEPKKLGGIGIVGYHMMRLGILITFTADNMRELEGFVTLMAFEGYHCKNYENAIKEYHIAQIQKIPSKS